MTRLGTLVLMVLLAPLVLLGQEAAKPRLLVVTLTALDLDAWQLGVAPGETKKVWAALPRTLDRNTREAWRREVPRLPTQSLPVIADCDDDGLNDLVVVDGLGITVYGQTPLYCPFRNGIGTGSVNVVVADVDGDGRSEIVTQRSVVGEPGAERDKCLIEIWERTPAGLQVGATQELDLRVAWTLQWADVDNDGSNELLTAGHTIVILKRAADGEWRVAAEIANVSSLIDVVRVGDVDGDKKNEIVATGNGGAVTVYKHRRRPWGPGPDLYPVIWQSPRLASEGLTSARPGLPVMAFTQGLALGDIVGDAPGVEILAATVEDGVRPGESKASNGGRIHLFTHDGQRGFSRTWVSDWTTAAHIPALAMTDVDGDGRKEFIYNGQTLYRRDVTATTFRPEPLCPDCAGNRNALVGLLPELREPATALRIVPVRWTLPDSAITRGRPASVALTLRSVWAEAKDVVVNVAAADSALRCSPQRFQLSSIPAGGTVTLPSFTVESGDAQPDPDLASLGIAFGDLDLDITAAGGYRQSVRLTVRITDPPKGTPFK